MLEAWKEDARDETKTVNSSSEFLYYGSDRFVETGFRCTVKRVSVSLYKLIARNCFSW